MKKNLCVLFASLILCFMAVPAQATENAFGFIFKNATEAGVGFSNTTVTKVGKAQCRSYFGVVGLGDCSVRQAAKNGNIRNVAYYDTHTKNIVGFKTITTYVYGN